MELNRTPVILKTKQKWHSTFVEVSAKKDDGETRYKTFILDKNRGIKLIKNLKTGQKKRVKNTCLSKGSVLLTRQRKRLFVLLSILYILDVSIILTYLVSPLWV